MDMVTLYSFNNSTAVFLPVGRHFDVYRVTCINLYNTGLPCFDITSGTIPMSALSVSASIVLELHCALLAVLTNLAPCPEGVYTRH
jgi:hypothetical protein